MTEFDKALEWVENQPKNKIWINDQSSETIFVLSPWEKGKLIDIAETLPF